MKYEFGWVKREEVLMGQRMRGRKFSIQLNMNKRIPLLNLFMWMCMLFSSGFILFFVFSLFIIRCRPYSTIYLMYIDEIKKQLSRIVSNLKTSVYQILWVAPSLSIFADDEMKQAHLNIEIVLTWTCSQTAKWNKMKIKKCVRALFIDKRGKVQNS